MPEHMINDENIVSNIHISNSNYRLQRLTKSFIELFQRSVTLYLCIIAMYLYIRMLEFNALKMDTPH